MVDLNNYEEYMLLYADRELTAQQEQELLAFLADKPGLKAELELYAATRLAPETIVYKRKEELIKKEPGKGAFNIRIDRRMWAAAAGIVLFAVLFSVSRKGEERSTPAVAVNTIKQSKQQVTEEQSTTPPEDKTLRAQPMSMEKQEKKFHSKIPVNTVAVRTPKEKPAEQTKQPTPPMEQEPEQEPIAIAQPTAKDTAVYIAGTATTKQTDEEANSPATQEPKRRSRILRTLIGDKTKGLDNISAAVTERLATIKKAGKELKDTELTLEFHNKELFTVRL